MADSRKIIVPILTAEQRKNVTSTKRFKTTSLFWENRFAYGGTKVIPTFNLSDRDHDNTLSMYNIYIACDTEYEAAMILLESWKHWEALCASNFFKKHVEAWREERSVREASLAHKVLLRAAADGNMTAARTILLESKKVSKAGRPSNQQVEKAARVQEELDSFLVSSINR